MSYHNMENLVFQPAHKLAQMIRDRTLSASELLDAFLKQIAAENGNINALITVLEDAARRQARAADEALARGELWGPLHGIPFTVKDCIETAGLRTTCGYQNLADYIPAKDATVVARMKAAGAMLLGKTNLAILASDLQTQSDFGRTNNPWNLGYTAGGSSGGSAAAIAAGFSPLDLCGDLGGSGRIPAHCCGVFGFKPTEHRVSTAGAWPTPLEGKGGLQMMYAPGVMARSIQDIQLWLAAVEGMDTRSPHIPPAPTEADCDRPLQTARIAWTDSFGGIPITAETQQTLEQFAHCLTAQGCVIEKTCPQTIDYESAWETYGTLAAAWLASRPTPLWPTLLPTLRKVAAGGPIIRGALRGNRLSIQQLAHTLAQRDRFTTYLDQFMEPWDAWICPVMPIPAFPHQPVAQPFAVCGQRISYLLAGVGFTSLFTLTGHPVVVVPIGQTASGLPIAVQLVGHRWGDLALLALANQIIKSIGLRVMERPEMPEKFSQNRR